MLLLCLFKQSLVPTYLAVKLRQSYSHELYSDEILSARLVAVTEYIGLRSRVETSVPGTESRGRVETSVPGTTVAVNIYSFVTLLSQQNRCSICAKHDPFHYSDVNKTIDCA